MENENYTPFTQVYDLFLSQLTDDMYLELTEDETKAMLFELLRVAIQKFEFPRVPLDYIKEEEQLQDDTPKVEYYFTHKLTEEEENILAVYMIVNWIGQQLASVQNVRMKYSGSDFKFTSQANHMQKLLQLKKDYEREGFHLQRLYKRRIKDVNGVYHSTFGKIMQTPAVMPTTKGDAPQ